MLIFSRTKAIAYLLACAVCLLCVGCTQDAAVQPETPPEAPATIALEDGTYEAEARGHNGMVTMQATFEGNRIANIEILSHHESKGICEVAFDRVVKQILDEQTLAVDSVTGATFTTRAIVSSVQSCVEQAGGDVDAFLSNRVPSPVSTEVQNLETDVVIVGAGLSGICTAVSAAQNGANVIVVERLAYVGGNSSLSTGVFHFGGTDIQKAAGVDDTPEEFNEFLLQAGRRGGGERDPKQTEMIAHKGNEVIKWMTDCGVVFDKKVSMIMGSPKERAHQSLPDAPATVHSLYDAAEKAGAVFMLETTATDILTDSSQNITGIKAESAKGEKYTISADKVILASGGYLANPELVERFLGYENLCYIGSPGARGEMLLKAMDLGADTQDIDKPFLAPTYSRQGDSVITSLVLSKGGILVTNDAERYCNETASYMETALNTFALNQPDDIVFEIFDEQVNELVYKVKDYMDVGIVVQSDTIEGLASELGLDAAALQATIDEYNAVCNGEKEDPFGRKILENGITKAPFYALKVSPGSNIAGGGLKVDELGHVLKTDGSVISGLYAVGEATGGFRAFGYAGGDSLSHCAVSGKVVGEEAAKTILELDQAS